MKTVSKITEEFNKQYKNLNSAQREAVDTTEGPVMVVAGPGTGKTQILTLRIGNILLKTDIKADGILCLTFTNSAVKAMQERLVEYIGEEGAQVNILTFHSFGMKIIETNWEIASFPAVPKLLDDEDTAVLFDEILKGNDWEYLRPRSDISRYFSDLKSTISLLKRERITSEDFLSEIEKEIKLTKKDPDNISTRGESKGELKKEVLNHLEGLDRSREVIKFFDLYERAKKEKNALDYDDVLENLVKIVETSKDAVSDIREKYLYVLVDEHQDSSKIQNEFLKRVWGKVESPNIMVVGDDRQLIYGFSGASIDHFQGFKKNFKGAKLITLVNNYRSTQVILDASHALLQSTMTDEKLLSQSKEHYPIRIFEAEYPRDEIMAAANDIKEKVKSGINIRDCAVLVPKNAQVREALLILHEAGLAVSSPEALNLFDQQEANALFRVLKIISDSDDSASLALSFFDKSSSITPLEAHAYLSHQNMREFSWEKMIENNPQTLFVETNEDSAIQNWINKLRKWKADADSNNLAPLIETVGKELLLNNETADKIVTGKEILDTIITLAAKETEKKPDLNLSQFLSLIDRLEEYGEHVGVSMEDKDGVKVLTLHSSKGLEFDYVWIAHMDERSLNSGKKLGFTLPESILERIEDTDIDKVKRKLYVAVTRAKRFCTLSYATYSTKDSEQKVAKIIADLPEEVFTKQERKKINKETKTNKNKDMPKFLKLVEEKYKDRYVSVSLLNNFFECPWKWYFENLLQLPKGHIEVLEFGIAVHASIDRILKMEDVPSREEVERIVTEEVLNRGIENSRERTRLTKEILSVVLSWVKNRLKEIKPSRKTEESISLKDNDYPHLKIYGKIDLIENLGNKELRVTDFKTGGVRKKSEIEKQDEEGRMSGNLRQLAMYSYLLRDNPKWKSDVRESRLEFLEPKSEKERFYDRVINVKEIELLKKDIKDYDELVKSGDWINRECHYNSYGKANVCGYCQMAKIYIR